MEVDIQIMRPLVRLRALMLTQRDVASKLAEFEKQYDKQFAVVFEANRRLTDQLRTRDGTSASGTCSLDW